MRSNVQRQAQRPIRLDAVKVEHLRAVQRREIASLAHPPHKFCEYLVPQTAHHAVVEGVKGQLAQRRPDTE